MTDRLALPSSACFTLMHLLFTLFLSDEYMQTFHKASNVSMFMHFELTRVHSESLIDRMFEREKGRRPSPSPKWRYYLPQRA